MNTSAPSRVGALSVRGFTLIETLVAITVLSVAIVGPFVAIQSAFKASTASRDQLIATLLAQEGIEYIRGVRDNNYLYNVKNPGSAVSWLYGIDSTGGVDCTSPKRCMVDPTIGNPFASGAVRWCGTGGTGACTALNLAPSSYLYTHQTPAGYRVTPFVRSVTLTTVTPNKDVQVTVTVSFTSGRQSYTVTLSETLSNWL